MTSIAPNGVSLADYDPLGIGGVTLAAVNKNLVSSQTIGVDVTITTVGQMNGVGLKTEGDGSLKYESYPLPAIGIWKAISLPVDGHDGYCLALWMRVA